MSDLLEYRLKETNLLLIVAYHETDKRLHDTNTTPKDREFYVEYLGRLKAAITDNSNAVIAPVKKAGCVDFEYKETKDVTFLTPVSDSGAAWLKNVFPGAPVKLNHAFSMTKFIGVQAIERLAHDGLVLKVG